MAEDEGEYIAYDDNTGNTEQAQTDGGGGQKSFAGSCGICCMGCLLFPAALVLLAWNDKNTVCATNVILKAEADATVADDCNDASALEGKFTFFSCPINDDSLQIMSPQTSFNLPGLKESIQIPSVAAAQKVEMYQCIETKEEVESSDSGSVLQIGRANHSLPLLKEVRNLPKTIVRKARKTARSVNLLPELLEEETENEDQKSQKSTRRRRTSDSSTVARYHYKMAWADAWYDSKEFHATPQNIQTAGCPDFMVGGQVNHNPPVPDRGDGHPAELGTQVSYATSVSAGAFTFNDANYMKSFTTDVPVSMTPFSQDFKLSSSSDNIVTAINTNTVAVHPDSQNYLGSCESDRLGCVRVSYNKSDASHITVMGLTGSSGVISPFTIAGTWSCQEESFIKMWPREMTKDEAISAMKEEQQVITWILRVAGLLVAWLSIYCVFDPIATAADAMGGILAYIPGLGEMLASALEGVVEMFLCIISCSFACSCGLLVIGLVWLAMRPVIGGPVMAASMILLLVAFCVMRRGERNPNKMRKHKQMSAEQQPLVMNPQ
jgi:hypothetical protein